MNRKNEIEKGENKIKEMKTRIKINFKKVFNPIYSLTMVRHENIQNSKTSTEKNKAKTNVKKSKDKATIIRNSKGKTRIHLCSSRLFILSFIFFTIVFSSISFAANPGHPASSISAGTFESGNFIFPNNLQINQNLTVSTDVLFVDNNTGRVGIGKTNPSEKLDVVGSAAISQNLTFAYITSGTWQGSPILQAYLGGISLPFGNISGTIALSQISDNLITQAKLAGISLPAGNITSGTIGSGITWNANPILQAYLGGITIPIGNATGTITQSRLGGITIPFSNTTGVVTQARMGGIIIPIGNTTGVLPVGRLPGHNLPIGNITGYTTSNCTGTNKVINVTLKNGVLNVTCGADIDTTSDTGASNIPAENITSGTLDDARLSSNVSLLGQIITQNEMGGITIPIGNTTGVLSVGRLPGHNLPAENVTNGTFGTGNYIFPLNVTIDENLSLNAIVSGKWKGNPIPQAYLGGITIPISNTTGSLTQARLQGITIPFINTTGVVTQARMGGIIIPIGNVTGVITQSRMGGISLPFGNISGTIALSQISDNLIPQAKLAGMNWNAANITSGTFASGDFVFPASLDVTTQLKVGGGFGSTGLTIDTNGNIFTDGDLTYSGETFVSQAVLINGSHLPYSNNIYDLGNSTLNWRDLYLSGTVKSGTWNGNPIIQAYLGGISLPAGNITSGNLNVARMPTGGAWALSSDLNVDSGKLFINNSNGNVGIGTTSPQAALHVEGGIILGNYSTKPTCNSNVLGMMVFDTTEGKPYVCNSTAWKPLDSDYDSDGIVDWNDWDDTNSSMKHTNLTAGNIKNGTIIFDVTGTMPVGASDADGDGYVDCDDLGTNACTTKNIGDIGDCDDTSASVTQPTDKTCDADTDNYIDCTAWGTSGCNTTNVGSTGDCNDTTSSITNPSDGTCDGDVDNYIDYSAGGTDCVDSDASIYPGAASVCDYNSTCNLATDDSNCGTIDCSGWYVQTGTEGVTTTETCYNKTDITTSRCEAYDDCKDANTTDCNAQSNDASQYSCGTCKYINATNCAGTTQGSCSNYASETDSGTCKECDGSGSEQTPSDDADCGTIDCSGWYVQTGTESSTTTETCYNKADITSSRCEAFGDCKDANTVDCNAQSNNASQYSCGTCKYIDNSTNCTGTTQGSCSNYASGTDSGTCKECDGSGNEQTPSDDSDCGTIDCDGLNYYFTQGEASVTGTNYCKLIDYDNITTNRCEGFGDCKDANSSDCTSFSNTTIDTCDTCKYAAGACSSCSFYNSSTVCGNLSGNHSSCTKYCDGAGGCDCTLACDPGWKDCNNDDGDSNEDTGNCETEGSCCVANMGDPCGGSECVNAGTVQCDGGCAGTSNKAVGTDCTGFCKSCDGNGNCVNTPNGQDYQNECSGLSCSGYYWGWSGSSCYYRANEPAGTHNCEGDGTCRDVADDCPSNGQGSSTGCSASSACRAGCSGTTGPTCYTSGQHSCSTCYQCNSASNCESYGNCVSGSETGLRCGAGGCGTRNKNCVNCYWQYTTCVNGCGSACGCTGEANRDAACSWSGTGDSFCCSAGGLGCSSRRCYCGDPWTCYVVGTEGGEGATTCEVSTSCDSFCADKGGCNSEYQSGFICYNC